MLIKMKTLHKKNMITITAATTAKEITAATATTTTTTITTITTIPATLKFWFCLILTLVILNQTKGRNDNQRIISGKDLIATNSTHANKSNNYILSTNDDGEVKQISSSQTHLNSLNSTDILNLISVTNTEDSFDPSDCITIREHQECFPKKVKEDHDEQRKMPSPILNEFNLKEVQGEEKEKEENEEQIKIKYAKQIIKDEMKQVKYVQKNDHKLDSSRRRTTLAITMPSPLKGTKETAIINAGQRQITQTEKQTKMLTQTAQTGRDMLTPHTGNLKVAELSFATTITKPSSSSPSSATTTTLTSQLFDVEPQESKPQMKANERNRPELKRVKEKLIDQLKLQEIITDDNNHPTTIAATTTTTTTIKTKSNIAFFHKTLKVNPGHQINIKPTKSSDSLTASTAKINDTTIKTEWHNKREPLSSSMVNSMAYNDFTGKLLAEKDGAIKEIEQKFRLKEFLVLSAQKLNKQIIKDKESIRITSTLPPNIEHMQQALQTHYNADNKGQMMEKRVKKSFEFPMHISFNGTGKRKFTNIPQKSLNHLRPTKPIKSINNHSELIQVSNEFNTSQAMTGRFQPAFFTTKFYNSKELYHGNKVKTTNSTINVLKGRDPITKIMPNANDSPKQQNKLLNLQNLSEYPKNLSAKRLNIGRNQMQKLNLNKTDKTKTKKFTNKSKISLDNKVNTIPKSQPIPTVANSPYHSNNNILATTTTKTKRGLTSTYDYANILEFSATTSTLPSHKTLKETAVDLMPTKVYFNSSKTNSATLNSTNPTKLNSKPKKSTINLNNLSFLQEKISSLKCDIQIQPEGIQIWRSNTTHELILPKMTPENCKIDMECSAMMVSWEGESEIQSGDILIIEINDALLSPKELIANTSDNKSHNVQVYQVTRSGHEHCDVTEGILLDIMPLILDDKKLVTLYDKDLTEGVNFLIVVYEGWDSQCVRLKVTTKTDNCGENSDCSAKGLCYTTSAMEEYECQCCSGFSGSHCEEIDACTPSPCTNNGICVDLSQGHEGNSYQCLCPYGYSGKNCQYELDPCNPTECMNGGSCVGNSTHFRCDCLPGFIGPLCQHSLNKCESSPCIHGICVNQEDGFRCFCQPGFAGELCNFEYNECESNPCLNQGECIDHIGSYECRCTKGYTGSRCQIKVDFCANKPCPLGHNCLDHGNDYSCECPGGRNGPDCNQIQRMQCNVNPCTHGGTCWSSGDSFYCACRPGYTGTMCEDEYVVETVISSSEFIIDDNNARNFNDKTYDSAVVIKSPIELHNAYFAAAVLAATIFIVAIVLIICHCKVNQTYRKFSTRSYGFIPILGFGRRQQIQNKFNKHWLSGKNLNNNGNDVGGNRLRSAATTATATTTATAATTATTAIRHYNLMSNNNCNNEQTIVSDLLQNNHHQDGQLHERPYQRHMPITVENDMYYTVDFSETTQHIPLIQ